MDFHEVEEIFHDLKRRFEAGAIDEEEFKARIEGLRVEDSQGRQWMIGVRSGKWYYYDGARWVQAEPPRTPEAKPAGSTNSSFSEHGRAGGSDRRLVVLGLGALAFACLLLIIALGVVIVFFPGTRDRILSLVRGPMQTPTLYVTATSTSLPSAQELLERGDEYGAAGQWEQAIEQYMRAALVSPQNATVYLRLGTAYQALGRCDEAIPEFQQALFIDPTLVQAQEGLDQCGGSPVPEVTLVPYARADLGFSILYPSGWFLKEEASQTVFAENEEVISSREGSVLYVASLPLLPEEAGLTPTQALDRIIATSLPVGVQPGAKESILIGGHEWMGVTGSLSDGAGEQVVSLYVAATAWNARLYALWAIAPQDNWDEEAWPIFGAIFRTMNLGQAVVGATPTASPAEVTPSPTATVSATATSTATPTTQPAALSGRMAFVLYEGGQYETYVANIDGSGRKHIWNRMHQADFDPSGRRLVVNGELSDDLDLQIIDINSDNSYGGNLHASRHIEDSWPSWSPDGAHVVFVFNGSAKFIRVLTDVTKSTEGADIIGPNGMPLQGQYTVWVPDGRIAFTGCDYWSAGTACGIYTVPVGGGTPMQVTTGNQDRATDAFDSQVLYMSPADGDWEIYKVSSTGGTPVHLTDNGAQDGLATWAPDGKSIAFLTSRNGQWEIWVMDADGTNQRLLFALGGDVGQWTEERLSWGPE